MPGERDDLEGTAVGGYRLVRRLGRGGMGAVYEAVQESLGRRVALKRLHPHLSGDVELVLRFKREAEAAARLGHPGIVAVTDFGRDDEGAAFLVMEYLDGRSLAEVVRAEAPLAPERVAYVAWQISRALAAAHDAGIVHRDLKPDNVMLVEIAGVRDVAKVLDFGIAKLTEAEGDAALTATGAVLGTPAYMAPEQARGGEVDARTDLYAVGAIAYEALTGRRPYAGESYNALIAAILTTTPPPVASLRAGLDPGLAAVVTRAMATSPGDRFGSAREMADALAPFTGGRAPSVSTSTPVRVGASRTATADAMAATAPSVPRPASRSRGPLFAALVGVPTALGLVAVALRAPDPPPPTVLEATAPTPSHEDAAPTPLDDASAPATALDAGAAAIDDAASPDGGAAVSHHAPRPITISYSGCNANALLDTSAVRAAFDGVSPAIAACITVPTATSLEYTAVIDGEGHVTEVHPHGSPARPERASQCVVRAMRGMSFPATRTGEGGDVDIWFHATR